jgi:hypothetical protein
MPLDAPVTIATFAIGQYSCAQLNMLALPCDYPNLLF